MVGTDKLREMITPKADGSLDVGANVTLALCACTLVLVDAIERVTKRLEMAVYRSRQS